MTLLSEYRDEHPVKVRRLAIASGGRCENCSTPSLPIVLRIHLIGNWYRSSTDLQKHLFVLCPACRRSFYSGRVEESLQRDLVRHRPRKVRSLMREIPEYRPRKYIPPRDFSPGKVFYEMITTGLLDLCLNGGWPLTSPRDVRDW